jgi:excisionase family DNA binding protein
MPTTPTPTHLLKKNRRPEPAVFTASDAALYLGLSRDTIVRMISRGTLKAVRPAGTRQWLVSRASLDALLSGCE